MTTNYSINWKNENEIVQTNEIFVDSINFAVKKCVASLIVNVEKKTILKFKNE